MDVRKEFLDILQDYIDFPVSEIQTELPFKAVSGVDSFIFIEMITAVEEHFHLRIPNADLLQLRSIDDIIAYIEKKLS